MLLCKSKYIYADENLAMEAKTYSLAHRFNDAVGPLLENNRLVGFCSPSRFVDLGNG